MTEIDEALYKRWREKNIKEFFAEIKMGSVLDLKKRIDQGFDVNLKEAFSGMTALHHAVARGARPCIRVLVSCGRCDYLIRDNLGRYASDIAIEWSRDFAVARLLSKHQARQARERGVEPFDVGIAASPVFT